jgi:GxxExxY protein
MDPDLPHQVIGACMNVHHFLGAGLDREVYEECLAVEFRELEMPFERGTPLTFDYRGKRVKSVMRLDFIVGGELLVKVMSCKEVSDHDKLQMDTLLRLSRARTGLLVNFNVSVLRKGIHRVTLRRRADGGS